MSVVVDVTLLLGEGGREREKLKLDLFASDFSPLAQNGESLHDSIEALPPIIEP